MIKAIVFDWGGVLIDSPSAKIRTYVANYFEVNPKYYKKLSHLSESSKMFAEFQKGIISEQSLWEYVSKIFKVRMPKLRSLYFEAFEKSYKEKPSMIALAKRLKKNGLSVVLLSNTEKPAVKFFKTLHYDFFDLVIFSCDEGTRKPENKIYKLTTKKLGLKPKKIVFIDDKEINIAAAEKNGMNTILFRTPKQVIKELKNLGVNTD